MAYWRKHSLDGECKRKVYASPETGCHPSAGAFVIEARHIRRIASPINLNQLAPGELGATLQERLKICGLMRLLLVCGRKIDLNLGYQHG